MDIGAVIGQALEGHARRKGEETMAEWTHEEWQAAVGKAVRLLAYDVVKDIEMGDLKSLTFSEIHNEATIRFDGDHVQFQIVISGWKAPSES